MTLSLYNMAVIYMILIPIISIILIIINMIISPYNNYNEKTGPFECGFTSFRQSRITYNVSFILIAILFLPFDIEITTVLPYALCMGIIQSYGMYILFYFLLSLLIGFIIEINSNILYINRIYTRHNIYTYNTLYDDDNNNNNNNNNHHNNN